MTPEELREFVSSSSMLFRLMLSEIEAQVSKAEHAANRLNLALEQHAQRGNTEAIWHDLQTMAEAAAAISRIIKPNPHRRRPANAQEFSDRRGEALRSLLDIGEDHPILARNLRNRLAHLDEDIDDWWLTSKRHIISRRSMGDVDNIFAGVEDSEIFEHFNFRTRDFIYRGERFSTIEMWNAVLDVAARVHGAKIKLRDEYGAWMPGLDQ
ncbi:hypothetical protein [Devosia submarina]|uniref:hypothetical protein n=1 Tax=Devosia submarina TaxID=1173082 RepID=UPI000D37772D|nr:hypothetical protein [Devosia submarina]